MNKFSLFIIIFLVQMPITAWAGSASVINSVSTYANTGEGDFGKSSVKVYTEINGEVVEDIEKEVSGGEEINYESKKEVDGNQVETKVNINTEIGNGTVLKSDFDTSDRDAEASAQSGSEENWEQDGPDTEENIVGNNDEGLEEKSFIRKILNYVFSFFTF